MNFVEFGKPLDLVNIDGERLSKVVIDELEHRWGELPTFNGHFLDLRFIERNPKRCRPTDKIKKVIFNDPATIVIWGDGTKTVVKCQPDDEYNAELGLAMAISKKFLGNKGNYNEVFKKWLPETSTEVEEFNFEIKLPEGYIDELINKTKQKRRRLF